MAASNYFGFTHGAGPQYSPPADRRCCRIPTKKNLPEAFALLCNRGKCVEECSFGRRSKTADLHEKNHLPVLINAFQSRSDQLIRCRSCFEAETLCVALRLPPSSFHTVEAPIKKNIFSTAIKPTSAPAAAPAPVVAAKVVEPVQPSVQKMEPQSDDDRAGGQGDIQPVGHDSHRPEFLL